MFRLVTILLIGVMILFSAPRAGMTHGMIDAEVTGAAQTIVHVAHPHEMCPDCAKSPAGSAAMDIACPHCAICVLFTPELSFDYDVSRALQSLGFPPLPAARIISRAPALDLPPPRIGFTFV